MINRRLIINFTVGVLAFTVGWLSVLSLSFIEVTPLPRIWVEQETVTAPKIINHWYESFAGDKQQPKIAQLRKIIPFCRSRTLLPVWISLIRDKYFKECASNFAYSGNCADMLEVKHVDLNQDGKKEILIRGANFNLCSAVGNCGFWIFEKKGRNYVRLLSASDYVDISELGEQIQKKRTNGYFDILLKGHFDVSNTNYYFYKFDGRKYRLTRSMVDAYVPGSNPNPRWEFITWHEFEKRLNKENN